MCARTDLWEPRVVTPGATRPYFVDALDQQGQGWKVPKLEDEMPYVIVPVKQ